MGDAGAMRARLARRLDELQRRLATHATVDDPGPGATTDRIAAVAPAIEELDALGRESRSAWATPARLRSPIHARVTCSADA